MAKRTDRVSWSLVWVWLDDSMTNDDLITSAESAIRHRTVNGRVFGDVAAALVSDQGNIFTGVAVDTPSSSSR